MKIMVCFSKLDKLNPNIRDCEGKHLFLSVSIKRKEVSSVFLENSDTTLIYKTDVGFIRRKQFRYESSDVCFQLFNVNVTRVYQLHELWTASGCPSFYTFFSLDSHWTDVDLTVGPNCDFDGCKKLWPFRRTL